MHKLFLIVFTWGVTIAAVAQPDVTTAFNLNNQGKYEEALTYIEKASSDPKATGKEKYWRYRGNILLNVAQDASLAAKYPDALAKAVESYSKARELDKYGDYADDVRVAMATAQKLSNEKGDASYKDGDFCNAAASFETALKIGDSYSIVDSAFIFNTAFCYDKCGNSDKALAGYRRCADIGYNTPEVFVYMSEIYQKQGLKDEAQKVLSEAREKYPRDSNLLRSEVNIYLNDNAFDKAEALLKSLTEADPQNETVWFVLGVTYEKLGKRTEEEDAYKKALSIKPDYYDALFNLGAMYFNEGLELEKTCQEIPARERAQYDDCIAKVKVHFNHAVDRLEKAYQLKKDDREIISALKDAYYKAERIEDYNRMKELLK